MNIPEKTFVFTFGRYNPPTVGHIAHFQAVKEFADTNLLPYVVYVSKTVDPKKNPISVDDRMAYIRKAIPTINIEVETNMFSALDRIIENGYCNKVIYFAGGDYFSNEIERRMFDRLTKHANDHGIVLEVKSTGDRQQGISATALRDAAVANDYRTFLAGSPDGIGRITRTDVSRMFDMTRAQLML